MFTGTFYTHIISLISDSLTISFESVRHSGWYLLHAWGQMKLGQYPGAHDGGFQADASFIPVAVSPGWQLISANYPEDRIGWTGTEYRILPAATTEDDALTFIIGKNIRI